MAPPVLVVIGDTHGTDDHRLAGTAREAVRAADLVVHTGDFTTATVLEAFEAEADDLAAVHGNNADTAVRDRLPATRVVEALDRRFVVTHGHEHDDTSLSLLARQEDADAVVVGHSHRPEIRDLGDLTLLNPGSHADPRWHRPAFATLERSGSTVRISLQSPEGTEFERATV